MNISAFNIGPIYSFKFADFFPIALNFLGPLFTDFFTTFLVVLPFFIVVFFPESSLTLNTRLCGLPLFLGTIPPFLFAARSAPLSTSRPTGGANKSELSSTGLGTGVCVSIVAGAVSSKVTTALNISSRKSSGERLVLLALSSFFRISSPTDTTNINL